MKRVKCGYRDRNDFRRSVRARRNKEAIAREINVVNAFAGAMEMLLDRRRRYFIALEQEMRVECHIVGVPVNPTTGCANLDRWCFYSRFQQIRRYPAQRCQRLSASLSVRVFYFLAGCCSPRWRQRQHGHSRLCSEPFTRSTTGARTFHDGSFGFRSCVSTATTLAAQSAVTPSNATREYVSIEREPHGAGPHLATPP